MSKVNIKDIDLSDLIVVKKSTTKGLERTVYYDRYNNEYIKIWNKDYFWKLFVYKADLLNVYKNTTLLKNMIYDDDDVVRGYISRGGKIVNSLKVCFKNPNKLLLEDSSKQNFKYKSLMKRLYKNMNKKEFIYLDLSPGKIAEYKGIYYFYDLEPFIFVEDLHRITTFKKLLSYSPKEYISKAQRMIKDSHSYSSPSSLPLYSCS